MKEECAGKLESQKTRIDRVETTLTESKEYLLFVAFNVQPNPCVKICPYILLFLLQHLLHGYDAGLAIIFEFQIYFHELLYAANRVEFVFG